MNGSGKRIRRLTVTAMLTAVALVLFVIEAQIPPLVAIPGIKMGLANIVTLVAMKLMSKKDAAVVLLLRVVLGSIFAGQAVSFLYSFSGGIMCFAVMCAVSLILSDKQLWAVSVFGAVAHNAGQLSVAALMLGKYVWGYAPVLLLSSVVTGVFTGLCAQLLLSRFKKIRVYLGD